MDDHRPNKSSSAEKFSFPVHESSDQFEFGCITTPGSPNAPADHLFSNGRLLPHVFPVQRQSNYYSSFSRSGSRASSISSKGSLVSSRSNSTNSRSSNCSSARTSTSEGGSSSSERRLSSNRLCAARREAASGPQRWQLIAAAPVLKHRVGSRSKAENLDRKIPVQEGPGGAKTAWFGRRILKSFVSACKECHAIAT